MKIEEVKARDARLLKMVARGTTPAEIRATFGICQKKCENWVGRLKKAKLLSSEWINGALMYWPPGVAQVIKAKNPDPPERISRRERARVYYMQSRAKHLDDEPEEKPVYGTVYPADCVPRSVFDLARVVAG